jgi:hypothetical protein
MLFRKDLKRRVARLQERVSQALGEGFLPPAEEVIRRMRKERNKQILGSIAEPISPESTSPLDPYRSTQ